MNWRVLQGDCREVLRVLPEASVDAVVTDPPYGTTKLAWDRPVRGWLSEVRRVLAPAGSVWVFGALRSFLSDVLVGEYQGWTVAEDVVWEKHNGVGAATDRFRRVHEQAVRLYPSDRPWAEVYSRPPVTLDARKRTVYRRVGPSQWGVIGEHRYDSEDGGPRIMRSVIFARSCHREGIRHGTPKPEEILQPLLEEACPPAGLVLDPFCGSGATGRAALLTGRRFLGIDLDPAAVDEAHRLPSQAGLLAAPASRAAPDHSREE